MAEIEGDGRECEGVNRMEGRVPRGWKGVKGMETKEVQMTERARGWEGVKGMKGKVRDGMGWKGSKRKKEIKGTEGERS